MEENKMLEYARALRADITYANHHNEELVIDKKEEKVLDWLIEQAVRAEMYKAALTHISTSKNFSQESVNAEGKPYTLQLRGKADTRVAKRHIKNMLFAIEDSILIEKVNKEPSDREKCNHPEPLSPSDYANIALYEADQRFLTR